MRSDFRLLYFEGSRLKGFERIEADNALAALHEAARRPSDDLAELWSGNRKLATFRPVQRHR